MLAGAVAPGLPRSIQSEGAFPSIGFVFPRILDPGGERVLGFEVRDCRVLHDGRRAEPALLPFKAARDRPSQNSGQLGLQPIAERRIAFLDRDRDRERHEEATTVPKTQPIGWHLALASDPGTEPIGQRIIEVPDDLEYFESRDGRARFTAYVPPGSLQKGEQLVATGEGKTVSCRICHGPDLKGLGTIPGIAGRSPSYVVRQLYDFQTGVRAGVNSALMKPVVEKLSMDDMIALAAYAASLSP